MKNTTVVFTSHGARVINNYKPLPFYNRKTVHINPRIDHLAGVPEIFWKLDGYNIVEMTRPEKIEALEKCKTKETAVHKVIYPLWHKLFAMASILLIFAIVYLLIQDNTISVVPIKLFIKLHLTK